MNHVKRVFRSLAARRATARPTAATSLATAAETDTSPFVAGLAVVRDEQDIIEAFVRYNLNFLDAILVLDNDSVDDTAAVLRALANEDPRLIVGRAPGFGHAQSERVTAGLREMRATLRPDLVLPLDADEFIRASSPEIFRAVLSRIPPGQGGRIPWQTYVMPDRPHQPGKDVLRRFEYRRQVEEPAFRKLALSIDETTPDIVVKPGGHEAEFSGGEPIRLPDLSGIALAHIPVRSHDQFLGKIICGWLALMAHQPDAREASIGSHWTKLFDRLMDGAPLSPADLRALSITYAQNDLISADKTALVRDPLGLCPSLQHSTGTPLSATVRVARAWRQSLRQQSDKVDACVRVDLPDLATRAVALRQATSPGQRSLDTPRPRP